MVMVVYTDNPDFADRIIPVQSWRPAPVSQESLELEPLISTVFDNSPLYECSVSSPPRWQYLLISESTSSSQYDLLVDMCRQGIELPDGLLCLAGKGDGLHGLKARPWAALDGNIHLSVYVSPKSTTPQSGIEFMILAAISVVDAIDSLTCIPSRAGIKWVNDILLGDAKVSGVLAYTQGTARTVDSAVVGIGLNVETKPDVDATPFVPQVGSLREYATDADQCSLEVVFEKLLRAIDRNYGLLLNGRGHNLFDSYEARSLVVGETVTVYSDDPQNDPEVVARGRVSGLGDNLELLLEGQKKPISRGRLVLDKKT